jgi:hypothetical protein
MLVWTIDTLHQILISHACAPLPPFAIVLLLKKKDSILLHNHQLRELFRATASRLVRRSSRETLPCANGSVSGVFRSLGVRSSISHIHLS